VLLPNKLYKTRLQISIFWTS